MKEFEKSIYSLLEMRKNLQEKIEAHAKEHARFCGQLDGIEVALEQLEKARKECLKERENG